MIILPKCIRKKQDGKAFQFANFNDFTKQSCSVIDQNMKTLLILIVACLSMPAIAQDHQEHAEIEIHSGHVHGQANIQIIATQNTLVFEMDFPADDLINPTPLTVLDIRNPNKLFSTQPVNDSCELVSSKFQKKALQGGHADYLISFEYQCKNNLSLETINLNPFFAIPSNIEKAKTHIIIHEQVLPPVELKKNNAILKLKKK